MSDSLAVPARTLLARILEQPHLVARVQALPPARLLALIDHVGLADAGELVALATVPQLERIFDEDLWHSARPGQSPHFDPERFGLWLEVMLEAGERFTVDTLAELSEDLLALALHELLVVVDLDEVALSAIDAELERLLEDGPSLELDNYRLLARSSDGWDALSGALAALDERHPDLVRRLCERLFRADSEWIKDNGSLIDVLSAADMLAEDAAAAREDRRARAGHVAPAAARGFLALPRIDDAAIAAALAAPRDPLTAAYFREYDADAAIRASAASAAAVDDDGARLATWLDEPATAGAATPRLEGDVAAPASLLRRTLATLPADVVAARMGELAYLANVFIAARELRPLDAAEAALATCDVGLQRAIAASGRDAADLVSHAGCDRLFRIGYGDSK